MTGNERLGSFIGRATMGSPPRTIPGATDGMKVGGEREKAMALLVAIVEQAAGFCEQCTDGLLRWWNFCPSCGAEVDWDAA